METFEGSESGLSNPQFKHHSHDVVYIVNNVQALQNMECRISATDNSELALGISPAPAQIDVARSPERASSHRE